VNSNLIVTGSITAQTLVVQTITSSVDFVTGSTRFGSSLSTSTHQFTGSVSITGSLDVITNGTEFQVTSTGVKFGNVIGDAHNVTGSVNVSGSLNSISASFSGNVGIGISPADYPLHILKSTSATTSEFIRLKNGFNDPSTGIRIGWGFASLNGAYLDVTTDSGGTKSMTIYLSAANATPSQVFNISGNGAATFASSVSAGTFLGVTKAGANGVGEGPYVVIAQPTSAIQYVMQLNASAGLDYWHYNGSAWSTPLRISTTGAATFLTSVTSTKFNTFNGTVSAANNTATLMQQCAADGGNGSIYLIIAAIGGAGTNRIAMGILVTVSQGGGTARWAFQNDGGDMFLTDPLNNGNIHVRHTIGGTQTINYSILRIG
jgi:hypothetical protein